MAKKLQFGEQARKSILRGASIVNMAVGSTLGPKANNVAIERPFGSPSVIHDGVSVAKEIELEDKFENIGAQLIKESAQKTNDKAGDGTTTATILTYAMAKNALRNIAAGANAMMLRRGMESAVVGIVEGLQAMSVALNSDEQIRQVATISAQDDNIGTLIFEAIKKLGKDCIIAVEESSTVGMNIEYKQGMQFDKGWISPYFVTDPVSMESSIEDPMIIVTDTKMTAITDFANWANNLGELWNTGKEVKDFPKNIVIISNEVSGASLASAIQNKVQGNLNINIIQSPSYGLNQKGVLEDIAIVTGGLFISEESGSSLATMKLEDYGHAKKIVSTKDSTMIVDGAGDQKNIDSRVKQLKLMMGKDIGDFDKEKLQERIAKLTSGIAVINVGGASEMEMREKKERCIDAIEATKAAIEEGIVPGGETAYLKAVEFLSKDLEGDIATGFDIVVSAVQKPFETLMRNSGYDPGQMKERLINNPGLGIDVIDGQIKDMMKAGIIDPVKVSRVALQNALSTAGAIITTNTLITTVKESKDDQPPMVA